MRYLIVLAALLVHAAAYAQPTINGVAGEADHGSTLTVSGSGFTLKGVAAPMFFETYEDGVDGQTLPLGSGWTDYSNFPYSSPGDYTYSSAQAWGGVGHSAEFMAGGTETWMNFELDTERLYLHHRTYIPTCIGSNVKLWRLYCGGVANQHSYNWDSCRSDKITLNCTYGGSSCVDYNVDAVGGQGFPGEPGDYFFERWGTVQACFGVNSNATAEQTYDGYFWMSLDYGQPKESGAVVFRSNGDNPAANFTNLRLGEFYSNQDTGSSGCRDYGWGCTIDYPAPFYHDDVYIDSTFARIEVGDDEIYELCSVREPQLPLTWDHTDGEITFEFNTGTFAAAQTAYVFVVDRNNNASEGYPITVGQALDPEAPGAPGQPQNVTGNKND